MPIRPRVAAASALLLALSTSVVAAQEAHDHGAPGHQVGRVTFPTSCNAAATPHFERAVAMLHSFWFEQARETFRQALAADPSCAMAHWGVAMTTLGNPFTGVEPAPERLAEGLAAAQQATAHARTARERDWAESAHALYRDYRTIDFRTRLQAHENALRTLAERYPDDREARIFHARAIVANAPPDDLTYARQLVAARMLEPLFVEHPEHPGLAHYLIHANDAPALAQQGLDAARRYAEIAPDAPHALHMPSHIFTRLGYWDESIETNRRSAQAEPNPDAAVHPMDYMVYAYLQQGRDREAHAVVARAVDLPDRYYGGVLGYNFAAMPARYALERGDWTAAAQLPVAREGAPYVRAISHFARAIGMARVEQPALAAAEIAELERLRDTLRAAGDTYWATLVDAQRLAASAWVARAHQRDDEAVRLAREAAGLEETVEKHPVTPGPLLPARELLGDLLLELGRSSEALAAYEQTLLREPNRARTLFGAGRAAELAGDHLTAQRRYGEFLELMKRADATRLELRVAQAYLAQRG